MGRGHVSLSPHVECPGGFQIGLDYKVWPVAKMDGIEIIFSELWFICYYISQDQSFPFSGLSVLSNMIKWEDLIMPSFKLLWFYEPSHSVSLWKFVGNLNLKLQKSPWNSVFWSGTALMHFWVWQQSHCSFTISLEEKSREVLHSHQLGPLGQVDPEAFFLVIHEPAS